MMTNLMTILERKVFISSNPRIVLSSCPPPCGHFSIQESATGGLSYKVKITPGRFRVLVHCLTDSSEIFRITSCCAGATLIIVRNFKSPLRKKINLIMVLVHIRSRNIFDYIHGVIIQINIVFLILSFCSLNNYFQFA